MTGAPLNIDLKRWLKFAIPLTAAVIVGGIVLTSKGEQLKVSAAKGGECIMAPTESVVKVLQKRGCDELHDAEVVRAFEVPDTTLTGALTPEEQCTALPDDMPAEDRAINERALELLDEAGYPVLISNNADTTMKRDYVCLVVFAPRQTSFGVEVATAVAPSTLP